MIRSDEEKQLWLRLIRTAGIGPVTFFRLLESLGSAEKVASIIPRLVKEGRLKSGLKLVSERSIQQEFKAIQAQDGFIITYGESDYPESLARCRPWSPPLLIGKGHVSLIQQNTVAIVGTRTASANGIRWATNTASMLGHKGWNVVSGLAKGIDTAAHKGSLESGTVAVLAGGIDSIYPPQNKQLYQQIAQRGLLLSENQCGSEPRSQDFPRRNRIIASLCSAVVVVEGMLRSGSLITARCALDYGREVLAVPGSPYDPRSQGCNVLIKDGATVALNSNDVLDVLERVVKLEQHKSAPDPAEEPPVEPFGDQVEEARQRLKDLLSPSPTSVDELIRHSGCGHQVVSYVLLELEMQGSLVRNADNTVGLVATD